MNTNNQNTNEQLLVRIDFGILITITVTLFSVWYFVSSNITYGVLAGTYLLMGIYLCYKKGQCLCNPPLDNFRDKRTENIAIAFFNTWIYIGGYCVFFNYLCPVLHLYLVRILELIFFIWFLKHIRSKNISITTLYKFFFFAWFLSLIITPKPSVKLDKDFYDYNDKVYVAVKNRNAKNWDIIGFVDENGGVIDFEKSTNGLMFKLNASSVHNIKKVYLVYPLRLDIFNHDKILGTGNLDKIHRRAKLIELNINVRDV